MKRWLIGLGLLGVAQVVIPTGIPTTEPPPPTPMHCTVYPSGGQWVMVCR